MKLENEMKELSCREIEREGERVVGERSREMAEN